MKLNRVVNAFGVSLLLLTFNVACSSLPQSGARSSYDDLLGSAIRAGQPPEAPLAVQKEAYRPMTGRMDHVEFQINNDLMKHGLDGNAPDIEFPELRSAFEMPSHTWRPSKGYTIPVVKNARVDHWIAMFTGPLRSNFSRWLRRASHYAPTMEAILRDYHLPTDLVYLSMIESGFNLHAYSHAHASGPWQFIKSTGKLYGLKTSLFVDDRRHLIKASQAAAAHLRDLYRLYGDWYLAFSAYNAGAGSVNRAIHRSGTRNYWKMTEGKTRFLRQETKDYVPRILAAAIISKNYRKYGFSNLLFEQPLDYEVVTLPDATDVSVIAYCAGTTVDEIKFLNPSLLLGVTPPGEKYDVLLPSGSAKAFRKNYARVPKSERMSYAFHWVKKGETLATLVRKYNVSKSQLVTVNGLGKHPVVKPGTQLIIPRRGSSFKGIDELELPEQPSQNLLVAKTLSGAAKVANVDKEELFGSPDPVEGEQETNDEGNTTIEPTPKMDSPGSPPQSEEHLVKKGETLSLIALRYGVSLSHLREWNQLKTKQMIKTGMKLKVSKVYQIDSLPSLPIQTVPAKAEMQTVTQTDALMVEDAANPSFAYYTVNAGDTLPSLAKKYNVSVALIRQWNSLGPKNPLKKGMNLKVPARTASAIGQPALMAQSVTVHKVRRGETLWDLSKKYQVTVDTLKKWNGLKNNQIRPNQKIRVLDVAQKFPASEVVAKKDS